MLNPTIKKAIFDLYRANLKNLRTANPKIASLDQSAAVRCPLHGYHSFAYFVADGVPAQYVCGHCWNSTESSSLVSSS